MNAVLKQQRRAIIGRIRKQVRPLLRESGFVEGKIGESKPVMLCCWKDLETREVSGFKLEYIDGFVRDGIIVDTCGGAMVWESFSSFPLEDLMLVEDYLAKHLGDLQ